VDVVTLERTAWSLAVADYLAPPRSGVIDRRLRQALAQRGNPITILVAGMGGQSQERAAAQRVPLPTGSFFSQVIAAEQPIIVDPFAPGELAGGDLDGFRGRNLRTVVGVPLWQHDQVIGVLCLESEQADACAPEDLMRLQRIADTISVFLANTRLIEQVQERTRELEGANQTQELLLRTVMDLSSPIVPIARHILVMPLVGAIDSRRAGHFIETVLSEIGTRQAQVVLIDITGVSLVDTGVANYLIRAAQAARLLGAEVVLVGITPSVAQTMVSLGIDLAQMVTRADLEGGFVYALARTGGRIVYGASVTQS
jgi:anti-anti-sigma regulatory factor